MNWTARILLMIGLVCPLIGIADDYARAEDAYKYRVVADAQHMTVNWTILPGYYLYRQRLSFESATSGVVLGQPVFSKGEIHEDEYFGKQEIYRHSTSIVMPFTSSAAGSLTSLKLKLSWQGCADAGLCYPPTTWEATVKLAGAPDKN